MPHLFTPITFRGLVLPNRIAVSPMCQYSCVDGVATDWHLVHLGSRASGGAGLVVAEATAVSPVGRISPDDLGLWDDTHIEPLARVARFVHGQGAVAGIQLAHAGRKASTWAPARGSGAVPLAEGGWPTVAPSAIPFADNYPMPAELAASAIHDIVRQFVAASARALAAGFRLIEIHAAHGYLLHEFLSPFSNHRADQYGGSFDNRVRMVREVVQAVRGSWPERLPLFVRISATDWAEHGGWEIEQSVELARLLREDGADLIDTSSGGNLASAAIPMGPGYQTAFAARIRRETGIATGAVGMITAPAQADHVIRTEQADLVFLAREFLRDPYWPTHAAQALGHAVSWPTQYLRAAPPGTPARTRVSSD